MVKSMEMEFITLLMEKFTEVIGNKIIWKDKEWFNIMVDYYIKAIFKMTIIMVKVYCII